jgi:hypothetical protein
MANWIIRANAPSIAVERNRVVLKSRRRVSISSGDELVLFSWEATFVEKARVLEVREASAPSLSPSVEGEEKRWWEIDIDEWKHLPVQLKLDEASTSLTFVRNWRRPNVHVRLAYRRLPDEDLKTLERGELFVARDAYLTFLDALPDRLVQLFLADNPRSLRTWRFAGYADRARALIDFIEQRVLSVGRVASAAQRQWDAFQARGKLPETHRLYVWDEAEGASPIDFTAQVEAFRALQPDGAEDVGAASRSQLTEIAELLASRQSTESRFENLFRNRTDE